MTDSQRRILPIPLRLRHLWTPLACAVVVWTEALVLVTSQAVDSWAYVSDGIAGLLVGVAVYLYGRSREYEGGAAVLTYWTDAIKAELGIHEE